MLALWYAPPARAATTCTASLGSWNIPVTSPGDTNVASYITYTCNTNSISIRSVATVRMCLAIEQGTAPTSTVSNRLLRGTTFSENMQFQIYKDANRTEVWGNNAANPRYLEVLIEYPLQAAGGLNRTGSETGTIPIYGRVPAQAGLAAGTYASTFSTNVRYRYRDQDLLTSTDPTSCDSGGTQGNPTSFNIPVSATVPNACTVNMATDLDFGSILATETGTIDRSSAISLTCSRRTPWQIGLSNGANPSGLLRRMAGPGGQFVEYQLYRNPERWDRWGSTLNVDTVAGTGTGSSQTATVYGRILNQYLTQAGTYNDTITVIVTY